MHSPRHHAQAALLVGSALLSVAVTALADPPVELLWPGGAPGAKGNAEGDKPTLAVYLPPADKTTGTAVVVCPGGGYGMLALDHEGRQVAQWLNANGVTAFVLTYRHHGTGYEHPAPLVDGQRAIRMVRSRAKEWHVDPTRIGILGFSAGGHLASTVGTHFDAGKPDAPDPIDRVSSRPDFMVLIYPVISMSEAITHKGSRTSLLGEKPDPQLVESLSNEKQVTPEIPPTFLVHTDEDQAVPAENSVYFYLALRKAKVPAEMHIYAKGPHGFGLGHAGEPVATWPAHCVDWMRQMGFLRSATQPVHP